MSKNLEASLKNLPQPLSLSFWRDYQGREVDLVVRRSLSQKIPIEFSLASTLESAKRKNFTYFFQQFKETTFALLVYQGTLKQEEIAGRPVFLLPWWLWW